MTRSDGIMVRFMSLGLVLTASLWSGARSNVRRTLRGARVERVGDLPGRIESGLCRGRGAEPVIAFDLRRGPVYRQQEASDGGRRHGGFFRARCRLGTGRHPHCFSFRRRQAQTTSIVCCARRRRPCAKAHQSHGLFGEPQVVAGRKATGASVHGKPYAPPDLSKR